MTSPKPLPSLGKDAGFWLGQVAEAAATAGAATDPDAMIRALVSPFLERIGDADAWQRPGALKEGERSYRVGGCFMVTPDEQWHMLIGSIGFPAEQNRLMIPIDAGHPGAVRQSGAPLLLANTDEHTGFRQYLKSSRMGSSMYAPMFWQGRFIGQVIMAAQARHTFGEADLALLRALASHASSLWMAIDGPAWLAHHYPPPDGFRVRPEGVDSR